MKNEDLGEITGVKTEDVEITKDVEINCEGSLLECEDSEADTLW